VPFGHQLDQPVPQQRRLRRKGPALIADVGGEPSATQRALIERVVWLTVKCSLIDAKIAAGHR